MGTRSTYRIRETLGGKTTDICLVYVQYDGYPEGHPLDTAKWLSEGKVVNGITSREGIVFNGAGCLAAQLIARMKDGAGGVYMIPLDSGGEEYDYTITVTDYKSITMTCTDDRSRTIFEGTPEDFVKMYE